MKKGNKMMFARITLTAILSAIYTSGWWAWAMWAKGDARISIVPLILIAVFIIGFLVKYVIDES
jgi:hypothetical protein